MRIKSVTLLVSLFLLSTLLTQPSSALSQPSQLSLLKSKIENYKIENYGLISYLSVGNSSSLLGNYRYSQRIAFAPGYFRSRGEFYNFETYRNLDFVGLNGRIFYTRGALVGVLNPYAYGSDGYLSQLIENNQLPATNENGENSNWYELGLNDSNPEYLKILKTNFEVESKNSTAMSIKDEIYFPEEKSIISFKSTPENYYITTKDKLYTYHLGNTRLYFTINSLDKSYHYNLSYSANSVREYLPLSAKVLK